jgi:hypothetical protein
MRNLLGVSGFVSAYASGRDRMKIQGEVETLTFQDENPRSGLNCLCLTMALLNALF